MNYKILPPSDELKNIVKQYIVFNSLENIENVLFLPDGGNFIVFNRGIKANSKLIGNDKLFPIPNNYSVSFKANRVKQILLEPDYKHDDGMFPIIVVELLPIGMYKLFNTDMSLIDFKYQEIDKELIEKYFSKLYTHENSEEELKYLDKSLIRLEESHNNTNLAVENVVDKIYNDYNLQVSIDDLLEEFDYSRSTLERHFKKIIGLTPKNFIYISKFCKTLLEYIEEKHTFHEIQYLYSDNSHMNAVFQKFLGVAPSEILKKVVSGELAIFQLLNLNLEKSNISKRDEMKNPLDILKYTENLNALYVEDDEMLRDAMSRVLKHYFHSLDTAENGREGLSKYLLHNKNNTKYDLVVTDINMPIMNGIDMIKEIFNIEPSQIIIIMSAHCEYITTAKELGVKAILTKPVDIEELSQHVFEIAKEIYSNKLAYVKEM